MRKTRLNNLKLSHFRREPLYEAIMADLVLMGALPKDAVEKFTDTEIPDTLRAPDGFMAVEPEPTDDDD
jgi:hypothetical protein